MKCHHFLREILKNVCYLSVTYLFFAVSSLFLLSFNTPQNPIFPICGDHISPICQKFNSFLLSLPCLQAFTNEELMMLHQWGLWVEERGAQWAQLPASLRVLNLDGNRLRCPVTDARTRAARTPRRARGAPQSPPRPSRAAA